MERSRFISVLNTLTKNQQQKYLDFVHSPYFNKHQDVKRFVNHVLEEKNAGLSPEKIHQDLYPGSKYDSRRIPDLMYKSLKLLEEFLCEEQYAKQRWERKMNLYGYIRENNLDELKTVAEAGVNELRSKKELRDSEYHYGEYLYQSEAYKTFFNTSSVREDETLQQKADQLDLFYLSARLRDNCEMINRARILSIAYEFPLLENILQAIEADFERYASYPAVTLYYKIILMLRNAETDQHFRDLKQQIRENYRFFGKDEQRSLFGYLQNHSIRKINAGVQEFYRELLDIYQYMIDAGLMAGDNINLQWDLKNMISIALRLGEHAWALATINNTKPDLPADIAQNAYTYNLANYYYETRDYKKATRLLQSVEFKEVYYSLDARAMLLKIYFEQEEDEAFYAHSVAFKTWLSRNKLISKDTLTIYGNMVKYAQKIFIFKMQLPYLRKKNQKKIEALKSALSSTKQIGNLNWLMREVEGLVSW
jgi:hypothetical protein